MAFVLDTHVLLWRLLEPRRLPQALRTIFLNEASEFVLTISNSSSPVTSHESPVTA
ncbi:MAG: hypothetical protein HY696_01110 [Deltaproteobacteria bacterium]|nr:hypothetical protein [Deltaproteobacteria bacterium]